MPGHSEQENNDRRDELRDKILGLGERSIRKNYYPELQSRLDELRESRRTLQIVLDTIPVRVFWKDTNLNYLGCNRLFAEDAGLSSPEEIVGRNDHELVWREQAESYRRADRAVLDSGQPKLNFEETQTIAGGDRAIRRTSKRPLCNDAGETIGLLGIYEDITDHKLAEAELHRTQALLKAAIEACPAGVVVADAPDVTIRVANAAAVELYGETPRPSSADPVEMPLNTWRNCYYPDGTLYRGEDLPASRAVLNGETVRNVELIVERIDGEKRWLLVNAAPVRDADGEVIAGVSVFPDITESKQAEDALKESERKLATLMSNLPGMAYRCRNDAQWTMEFVSDGCRDVTGYAAGELIENRVISYADLIHEDDRDEVRRRVDEALFDKKPFELSYRIHTAAGAVSWLWERGRGVFAEDGTLVSLEGFVWDITEQKLAEADRDKLEEQLRQSQKMEAIGQLAGGVAHDFNNILTAIFGNVELAIEELESKHPEASGVLQGMKQIEKSAQRAAALTRQLLAFSRRQMIRPEVLDLNETIRGLGKMLLRLITEDIQLQVHCEPRLHACKVDPGQMEQAIVNLVVNARDAMNDGGCLTLETKNVVLDEAYAATRPEAQAGAHVLLAVSDTGCGMDQETQDRIFEPFFTTKPAGQGTGLGLSTVYGIVKQVGGNVAVYSEPGRGTTFKIYLPVVHDALSGSASPEVEAAPPVGTETIMVCEDDPAVRDLTACLLKEAGYTLLVAGCADEALELAASHAGPIDALVTDVIMPGMNGRKLADALSKERPEVRTLFVSGYTANVIAHHGVLDEDVEFLEKPYSRRQILQRVREVLDGV